MKLNNYVSTLAITLACGALLTGCPKKAEENKDAAAPIEGAAEAPAAEPAAAPAPEAAAPAPEAAAPAAEPAAPAPEAAAPAEPAAEEKK